MNIQQIKNVMRKYGEAWEKQDVFLILDCFIKGGIYQESPLSKPYKGHKEIKEFWEDVVLKDTKNIKFTFSNCHVSEDGNTGFAEWECNNIYQGKKNRMVGIMILKMKGDKISYLNEYWNTKVEK